MAINERMLASRTLMAGAQSINDSLSTFSSWLMVGIGSAFSLIIANFEKISLVVEIAKIRWCLSLMLVSLGFSVIIKLLLAMVAAMVKAHEAGTRISEDMIAANHKIDLDVFLAEHVQGMLWIFKAFTKMTLDKVRVGDVAVSARIASKTSQATLGLVFLQAILIIVAATMLVCGLKT